MFTSDVLQQANAPWGLARLAQDGPLADKNPAQLNFQYTFDSTAGQGVDVYVVDTGIRTTHKDFGGRATFGASFGRGVPGQDLNGHGKQLLVHLPFHHLISNHRNPRRWYLRWWNSRRCQGPFLLN